MQAWNAFIALNCKIFGLQFISTSLRLALQITKKSFRIVRGNQKP